MQGTNIVISNFALAGAGRYTAGVYRIDAPPIANPQPTSFSITITPK
jgi:hypothetical protein